ncbi:methylthioribose kinase [Bacillus coahuilensis m2-6]|uniref:S-methyl-5-thioribose kinase n=1 Tax=Bacillus coahuilensis TaxID=408580 RepID=UPI0001850B78|nr:S-methyl-5-thioribose kinase [Bacillus coahuilensis]KUP09502.1 methylthioribose kinase [Bacillus coahuilensis m2-6]
MNTQFVPIYQMLTEETAIKYVKDKGYLVQSENVLCEEIGDGNLNLVFRIVNEKDQSVIVKQALPYAKVVGESWPLTIKRAEIEGKALQYFSEHTPQFVPKLYGTDTPLAINVMEDLSDYKILRTGLMEEGNYPDLPEHIGEFLAHTLFYSSDFGLHQGKKKERVAEFVNPELCKITEDLVFTDPFYPSESNNFELELQKDVETIWHDPILKLEVAKLKRKFLTEADCLVHGDLHTGSIFVTGNSTKVIDPEFAFYGPIGFDIGQFFANILLNALSVEEELQSKRLQIISKTWDVFSQTFSSLWTYSEVEPFVEVDAFLEDVLKHTWRDSLGFAGCEIIRRTIGLAHVADLDSIQDQKTRIKVKKQALALGRRLITQRTIIPSPNQLSLY